MELKIDKGKPVCPQLAGQISAGIAIGALAPGEKLKSVREIALEVGVNPNTVQKTFEQLEGEGFVRSVRGVGWFVTDDGEVPVRLKREMTKKLLDRFFDDMKDLGYTAPEIVRIAEEYDYE